MNDLDLEKLKDLGSRYLMRRDRLKRLLELNAPKQVVEQEKKLVKQALDALLTRKGEEAEAMRKKLGILQN